VLSYSRPLLVPASNIAVNGDLQSALAGTSFTASGHAMEMWRIWALGTGGAATVTRQLFTLGQTDVPNNPTFFLRWVQSTGATTAPSLSFAVEDVRTLADQWITVSFWARSSVNLTTGFFIRQSFGTGGGSPSADTNTTAQDYVIGATWTRFIYTVRIPSIAGKNIGNNGNSCLRLFWNFPLNTVFTFEIADLKVEEGRVATSFQRMDDAFRVYRYYQSLVLSARFFATAGNHSMEVPIPYQRVMRGIPTTTLTSGGGRVNQTATYPLVTNISSAGGRFFINSAAAGDCYAVAEILLLDARL